MSSHKPAGRRVWRVGQDKSGARPPTSRQVMSKAILPEKLAAAFHRFCQLNPKACPIIGISEAGNPGIPSLGIDLDIRTDLPRYRVWRDGKLIEEPTDIVAHCEPRTRPYIAALGRPVLLPPSMMRRALSGQTEVLQAPEVDAANGADR